MFPSCFLLAALALGQSPNLPTKQPPTAQADTAVPPPPAPEVNPAPAPPPATAAKPPVQADTAPPPAAPAPAPAPAPTPTPTVMHVSLPLTLSVTPTVASSPAPAPVQAVAAPVTGATTIGGTVVRPTLVGLVVGRIGECLARHGQERIYLPRQQVQTAAVTIQPVQQVVYAPPAAPAVQQVVAPSPQSAPLLVPRKAGIFGLLRR